MAEIFWVTDRIAVSGAISDTDIAFLKARGIGAIMDIRSEYRDNGDLIEKSGMKFLHVPVDDRRSPSFKQMGRIFDFAGPLLDEGRKILIHCQNGCGRSPIAAIAVLAKRGMSIPDAVCLVKDRNPKTGFTERQERFVYAELEKFLRSPL